MDPLENLAARDDGIVIVLNKVLRHISVVLGPLLRQEVLCIGPLK